MIKCQALWLQLKKIYLAKSKHVKLLKCYWDTRGSQSGSASHWKAFVSSPFPGSALSQPLSELLLDTIRLEWGASEFPILKPPLTLEMEFTKHDNFLVEKRRPIFHQRLDSSLILICWWFRLQFLRPMMSHSWRSYVWPIFLYFLQQCIMDDWCRNGY